MKGELIRERPTVSDGARVLASKIPWQRLALAAILILSAFLNLFRLTSVGYGNPYYAAAVKDMLTSWHNFFFVSFDAGFVTVDKPPLGLWIQAASAWLFGFHGWSLLLPQALAGILSVALLYHLVRRSFGPVAGLIAALVLAVTPIAIAIDRTNDLDSLLVLTVLVGAWVVTRAAETGRLRWLLLGAVVVGLGFNVKMLEAYLILPAFWLLYLLASPISWRRRLVHLVLATAVLAVVSLSWAVVVDLTPADQRPYVGSSSDNSELDLAFGYNGATRLLGRGEGGPGGGGQSTQQAPVTQGGPPGGGGFGPGGNGENGAAGPFRLLDQQLAGQIGWLLPLAIVGLLAAGWQRRPRLLQLDHRQGALVLWGTWLLTQIVFFSVAGMFHSYYTVMLAPAIAALVGIGVVALWSDYRRGSWRGWLLPLALVGMAVLHVYVILTYYDEDWSRWLASVIAGLCLVSALGLVILRLIKRPKVGAYAAGALAAGVVALLIAPTAWAGYTTWQASGGMMATAGPRTAGGSSSWGGHGGPGGPGSGPPGGGSWGHSDTADPALLDYLQANQGDAKYLVATTNSMSASPIILNTDEPDPVIDLGGFMGRDPVLSTGQLADLVNRGAVRFFLLPDRGGMEEMIAEHAPQMSGQQGAPPEGFPAGHGGDFLQNESTNWVQDNCQQVPRELWQSSSTSDQGSSGGPGMMRAQALYDCDAGGR